MQKLQDSVFSITKTTNLSPAVFSFLQPAEEFTDKTPLGGILSDTKHGWLALGPKFCVIDLRSGLKIAARIFGNGLSSRISVTSVVELPTPLTPNSKQLVISLECDNVTGMICVFHINGSQLLHCIQTDVVVTELSVCDDVPSGPFMCFDGLVMAGTRRGEVFVFDLNRACLVDALKNISQGQEDEIHNEENAANLVFLPLKAVHKIESQRDLAVDNHDHLAVLLNETSLVDSQYIFRNPDGTVRMKAKRDHIRVTVVQYIPQLASLAVGYNFGAFQIWNLLNLELEFTSQVNVECLPVTHFGFQEPCDDPRAFCYLWVVFSVIDRFEEEEFPLAVMYSLTYQGKRMLSENAYLYQEFSTAAIRFQVELGTMQETNNFIGGRCVSCHTYSVNSTLGDDGDDSIFTNICQLVWECWGENANSGAQHGMLLFDLDQWYKDQMPATYRLESNASMSATWCTELAKGDCLNLDVRLDPRSVSPYSHATRLEEHFYPNSLQYNCICLNTSEAMVLHTAGVQRQLINCIATSGPSCLLSPARLRAACAAAGLAPLYREMCVADDDPDEQRRYLLSVALEARLSSFLKRCAHDWATGTHTGAGCTLSFLVDWCWKRAIELKENAKELTAPLFTSSTLPDRNVIRCLEHCVQQLTQLTGLLDAVLTKCCNLVVPDALSEMEEKYKGIGTVSLYFQVVQWFLRVGLLPERHEAYTALPYPAQQLCAIYKKRRMKLQRLEDKMPSDTENESCSLLYIDQLIEYEFGGERIHNMWVRGGSETGGLYPPPSLYALLRLYLAPDIAEEHKHSLVLYLLVDYSMVYDDVQYEEVIRRLMQFPTMFGLSNTAIKATQAFWHLDHRDFDFALDQLQCLTGNTLSEWQHNVVLSSLLAQKKTQAALQYLHVRKPAPVQNLRDKDTDYNRLGDHDKLEDWQSCCNLYLARGLVFEALDVIRMCVQNAASVEDKMQVLNFFFKGCRNTGQLSKVLNVTLMPLEEDLFIRYLQNCNEPQTSDVLIMYYLQQARYIEAEQYNSKIKSKGRAKDFTASVESLLDVMDREGARDTLVEVVCSALPPIASTVAHCARVDFEPHIIAPKPMSVFVQARSPKNTFTYKSSFIQDTIENASETWINKPQMRRGIKRALDVEETPFICTPKLFRTKSLFPEQQANESTPPKRAKLNLSGTPRTPKAQTQTQTPRVSEKLSKQMATLLDMPEVQSPGHRMYTGRSGAGTPQSILKNRRLDGPDREAPSPTDSRYLDSDDELLETASNHTVYSDSKHLRFTIPTGSEDGSTPSPVPTVGTAHIYKQERESDNAQDVEQDYEMAPSVSPPKKLAVEEVKPRKSYKDTVKARRSLSISANSSLSEDPNTSIESIADIPMTLINPKYSGERLLHRERTPKRETEDELVIKREKDESMDSSIEFTLPAPKTPQGRKSIRNVIETTPLFNRSRSATPERTDSPVITPLQTARVTRSRSRSRTPELRLSPLAPIQELPKQESNAERHPSATMLSVPRVLRNRSRSHTPEKKEATVAEPRLAPITESPTKAFDDVEVPLRPSSRPSLRNISKTSEKLNKEKASILRPLSPSPATSSNTESPVSSPTRRSLRSRSRTPDPEVSEPAITSPRILRSRSKTPEKLLSPKKEPARSKKSLSRIVLEHNTFAKTKQNVDNIDLETENESKNLKEEKSQEQEMETQRNVIECTPMKPSKEAPKLMDMTFSPIINKSVLQSSSESVLSVTTDKIAKTDDESITGLNLLPAFTTINESYTEKSVLHSYQSSIIETSSICIEKKTEAISESVHTDFKDLKSIPGFSMMNETGFGKSVLKSFQSSIAEASTDDSRFEKDEVPKTLALKSLNETEFGKSVLRSEDSSVAMTSDESLKGNRTMGTNKNISSLMTDDSDIEMKEWEQKMDSQDTARVIQKEKEKIVEIQREINEIEDDMSDDCQVDAGSDSDLDEEGEEESEVESDESSPDEENDSESGQEVISIEDSDDSVSSIPQGSAAKSTDAAEKPEKQQVEHIQAVESNDDNRIAETVEAIDPLEQAQISMLTDDNSLEASESANLNYSDELKADGKTQEQDFAVTSGPTEKEKTVNKDQEEEKKQKALEEERKQRALEEEKIQKALEEERKQKAIDEERKLKALEEEKKLKAIEEERKRKALEEEKRQRAHEEERKLKALEEEKKLKAIEEERKRKALEEEKRQQAHEEERKLKALEEEKKQKAVEEERKRKALEEEKKQRALEEERKQKALEEEKKQKAVEEERKRKSLEEEKKQKALEEEKKQKALEEEIKQKALEEKKQKVLEEERKCKVLEEERKQKVLEEERKRKALEEEKKKQALEEERKQREEEDRKQKALEVERKQKALDEEKKHKALEEESKQKALEEERKQKALDEEKVPHEVERPTTPSRKRTKPTSSNKPSKDNETDPTDEPKTSRSRRAQSTDKSMSEEKSPPREVRKIITRRASKELGEKMDESEVNPDDVVTPRRRARSKSKDESDAAKSVKADDVRPSPVRRGRRKPDLSVIPEVTSEESGLRENEAEIIKSISDTERLTRHQKAVLETWLEPVSSPPRRSSVASRTESLEGDDEASQQPAFDVQPMDRISLLNKADFEGSPDEDEPRRADSPVSSLSETRPRNRLSRAASESKAIVRPARITRKKSVDIATIAEVDSPVAGGSSPARGRRASFTKACEALHTPKGRRTSVDVKRGDTDSQPASPATSEAEAGTPARRSRRLPSAAKEATTPRRTRKTSEKE